MPVIFPGKRNSNFNTLIRTDNRGSCTKFRKDKNMVTVNFNSIIVKKS
jgi:hypothetical protein